MKRVVVAPLDWGLGHATRCVPIIRALLDRKCKVFLAGSGDSLTLLKKEFPELIAFNLPGYQPEYPSAGLMVWKMVRQLPRFRSVIHHEHRALEGIVKKNQIDIVISDNRYGCWSRNASSVFITHQSNILMPKRFGWLSGIVRKKNLALITNFDVCWIPDREDFSMAGDLISFGSTSHSNVHFIGHLSRFNPSGKRQKKFDVAVILSGPEPQRSMLERIVVPQVQEAGLRYMIVRGLPSETHELTDSHIVNFLAAAELQHVIEGAETVVARSGYSTIMDMAALQKKAIFIPTPGQTEQLYLAKRLKEMRIAFSMPQSEFDLKHALKESSGYHGFSEINFSDDLLSKAIDRLLIS